MGWLCAHGIIDVLRQDEILSKAEASCVEVVLGGWVEDERLDSLMRRYASPPPSISISTTEYEAEVDFKRNQAFPYRQYRSLHLPTFDGATPKPDCISLACKVDGRHRFNTMVTHPQRVNGEYPIGFYESMLKHFIPLAIENMDSGKDSGYEIHDITVILAAASREYIPDVQPAASLKFVLDVRHADTVERINPTDPTKGYAWELFEATRDRLVHLHVSGGTPGVDHSLLYKAAKHEHGNVKAILGFIAEVLAKARVPIILEGEYSNAEELAKEIEFVKKELRT